MSGDLETVLTRLRSSADRIAMLREETDAEMERRNGLLVEARDLGASWRRVAEHGRMSISGAVGIVNAA